VWAPEEYAKLVEYDRPTGEQPHAMFMCHHAGGEICAGWVAHNDPIELLALRLAMLRGDIDPETFDYTTTVPLFPTGQAAAEHGMRDILEPGEDAREAIRKLVKLRNLTVE
jgi:hypothetical protein